MRRRGMALVASEEARYCVLCQTYMTFEQVEFADRAGDLPASEWICVSCGSAVYVDPPLQIAL